MRMNLNQQSSGAGWETHKALMRSTRRSSIAACTMSTLCARRPDAPKAVHAVGARLADDIAPTMYNYGHLHIAFEDGSVGWYEAGWGPMMSETAFFVKDISVRKAAFQSSPSSDGDQLPRTSKPILAPIGCLCIMRRATRREPFSLEDEWISTEDEPDHQELCAREQKLFLRAIHGDVDLGRLDDALNSLRIVLAADESVRTGRSGAAAADVSGSWRRVLSQRA